MLGKSNNDLVEKHARWEVTDSNDFEIDSEIHSNTIYRHSDLCYWSFWDCTLLPTITKYYKILQNI